MLVFLLKIAFNKLLKLHHTEHSISNNLLKCKQSKTSCAAEFNSYQDLIHIRYLNQLFIIQEHLLIIYIFLTFITLIINKRKLIKLFNY